MGSGTVVGTKALLLSLLLVAVLFSPASARFRVERTVPTGGCVGFCDVVGDCGVECSNHGYSGGACAGSAIDRKICCCIL